MKEPDNWELFKRSSEMKRQQRDVENRKVISYLKRGDIPTCDEIRNIINWRIEPERMSLMRHHVYWKKNRLKESLKALYSAAHQAYIDICRHAAALGAFSKDADFETHVAHVVGHAAQKDMMAYCALVVGLQQTLENIQRECPDDINTIIEEIKTENFGCDVAVFIRELRNNLSHGAVIVPEWQISWRDGISIGTLKIGKENLKIGRWNSVSKAYIERSIGESIDLPVVVGEHFKMLKDLYEKIENLFARNVTDEERDFFEIEDLKRRKGAAQWITILVTQIGKGKNPYDYLHRYFSSEEVREIRRKPFRSKEQVDYMISLKSVEFDCNDQLRQEIYRLFGVVETASE